ncbi:MAG: alpha/beta hydrolase [Gemmataceae bacterium]
MMRVCVPLAAALLLAPAPRAAAEAKIEPDLIYGRKDGMALTLDVIRPDKPNGAGILWMQSGGWYSIWAEPKALQGASKPFLDKGFTMFIVRHGSAPKYAVPDAVADVRRAVRFVRLKAKDHGVDPERLGVMGGSAGGHLSLMLGTTGDDGNPSAKDEVLRQSSRVAAVVALFPPTDLRGFTTDPPAEIKKHPGLKPPLTFDAKLEPEVSPLLKASEKSAPAIIIHGDKDLLVPIEHGQKMIQALEKFKVPCELVTVEGAGHGYSPKQNKEIVLPAMVRWFETHLAAKKALSRIRKTRRGARRYTLPRRDFEVSVKPRCASEVRRYRLGDSTRCLADSSPRSPWGWPCPRRPPRSPPTSSASPRSTPST